MLRLFNSLTRKIEDFLPIQPDKVGLYTCGPTVYNFAHIGNLRTYLFEDFLRRALVYNGFKVNHVMNMTDVGHLSGDQDFGDDKMEKEGGDAAEIMSLAKKYTDAFLADLKILNILQADTIAPATEHIKEQIEIIQILLEKGFAYETELAIYFDVVNLTDYPKLTHQKLSDMKTAARSDVVIDKNKKHPADFALWFKLAGRYENHILRWTSPWGDGFPGWHIECSAMSRKYLGQPFDIHTGGIDHLFPHHPNEIAQSEAAFGTPLANYWLHGEHLLVNEGRTRLDSEGKEIAEPRRMGKSEGNFLTLQSVLDKNINPLSFRYLALTTHYRSKLNFSWESLQGAANALNNLYSKISSYESVGILAEQFNSAFTEAINDDLNTPKAIAVVWDLVNNDGVASADKLATLIKFDSILGLKIKETWELARKIPDTVKALIEEREHARKAKNFAKSDELRKQIEAAGFALEDTVDGVRLMKKF